MARYICLLCAVLAIASLVGCASRGRRVDADVEAVTTNDFNPKDLQLISRKSVSDLLSMPAVDTLLTQADKPFVYVGKVRNLTDEHINGELITEYVSVELSKSDKVRLSGYKKELDEALSALEFQQGAFVNPTTAKKIGKMIGASYLVQGELSNISVSAGWKKGQYFLFTLTLVDIETLQVWKSQVEVQKVSKRGLFGW